MMTEAQEAGFVALVRRSVRDELSARFAGLTPSAPGLAEAAARVAAARVEALTLIAEQLVERE
jgi:hypothetical protein